jgi:hypothetical protein
MSDADWIKFLLGAIITLICSWVSYIAGARGKMTEASCAKCQDTCKRELNALLDAIKAKQDELSARQDKSDDEIGKKLDILFRMLRATILRLPIDENIKTEILNERGSK